MSKKPYVVHDQDGGCNERMPDTEHATRYEAESSARAAVRHHLSMGRRDGEVWISHNGTCIAAWPLATSKPPRALMPRMTAEQRRSMRQAKEAADLVKAIEQIRSRQ